VQFRFICLSVGDKSLGGFLLLDELRQEAVSESSCFSYFLPTLLRSSCR
jgi:hypothetical protein